MWKVGLGLVVTFVIIWCTHWIRKWRNPTCNGILPPGSMGLPFIGETLELLIPSHSIDLHPFVKTRIQRYGPIFRTSIAGRPVVLSTDTKFNNHLLKQEGRLVEMGHLDTFAKLFGQEGENRSNAIGHIHKYARNTTLGYFGPEALKQNLIPKLEEMIQKGLHSWLNEPSIEVRHALATMGFDFLAKEILSYDFGASSEKISERVCHLLQGIMSFPLNIPGTSHHKCLKDQEKINNMMKKMIKERRKSPGKNGGKFLDHLIREMNSQKFLTEDFVLSWLFGVLYATCESISGVLTLIFKFLSDHPSVVQQLMVEHDGILKKRKNLDSSLTWEEYKSMTFTLGVINETLRLGNMAPGLFRRAIQDIEINGYTIPKGWTIMIVTSAMHLNPNKFKDPMEFNPWRWKEYDSQFISKNFMPFGAGTRQCAGADYSRVFLSVFLHVLVTKYKWTHIKGGNVVRNPVLGFGDGIHIKVYERFN